MEVLILVQQISRTLIFSKLFMMICGTLMFFGCCFTLIHSFLAMDIRPSLCFRELAYTTYLNIEGSEVMKSVKMKITAYCPDFASLHTLQLCFSLFQNTRTINRSYLTHI